MDVWIATAFGMTFVSLALSFYAIVSHLCNFTKPYLQRYIIRILWMVPIYSLNCCIALVYPAAGLYLDSFREIYESFVIYSFMEFLLNFLRYDSNLQQYIEFKQAPKHIFPFCLLPACPGGSSFMVRIKSGILQYVIVRPITSLIAFASKLFGFYGEGNYDPLSGFSYPVLLMVNNFSQVLAMYCLVIFYTSYKQELEPMKPLKKFLSIKLVVFVTFFQSVVVSGLMEIPAVEDWFGVVFPELEGKIDKSRKLQEFLICFDMMIAAIGHQFAFSHKPFMEEEYGNTSLMEENVTRRQHNPSGNSRSLKTCFAAFCNTLDFGDEKNDLWEQFGNICARLRQLFSRKQPLPAVVSSPTPSQSATDQTSLSGDQSWMANQALESEETPANAANQPANYQTIE